MKVETLIAANSLKDKIRDLDSQLSCLEEIKKQATGITSLGLNLHFVNVKERVSQTSFGTSKDQMKFILNYFAECLEQQKKELEAKFEEL